MTDPLRDVLAAALHERGHIPCDSSELHGPNANRHMEDADAIIAALAERGVTLTREPLDEHRANADADPHCIVDGDPWPCSKESIYPVNTTGIGYTTRVRESETREPGLDVERLEKAIRQAGLPLMYGDESLPQDEDWPEYAAAVSREYAALASETDR